MKNHLSAIAAALLLAGATSLAFAEDSFNAGSATDVLELAKGYGSASLFTLSDGTPQIVGRMGGRKYAVNFYGCTNSKACKSLHFTWSIDFKNAPMEDVNKWNRSKRFAKAYIDTDGDLALDMDVNVTYGVTRENLDDSFGYWELALNLFYKSFIK